MSPVLTLVYLSYKIIIIIKGFSQNFANLNLHLSGRDPVSLLQRETFLLKLNSRVP